MLIARPLIIAAALASAPGALAQGYPGQQIQTVPSPTPDADALAGAMRRLAANPRDLAALLESAELSLKLGDVNAAASLLKRAENVDPMNGRVKAGMARLLVTQERPGEALRYFDQSVGYGLDPKTFAGDRGLAYDLVGEQERAQRDYRTALKTRSDEEVERRYALSLAISGKRQEALDAIDGQIRRNDRGAWRVRAFVLAMTGDVAGAEKIANTMMPPGMGAALAPFFARVAGLPPADRAFAVHFGQLRPTPQRLADARMVPPLPVLAPEESRPVQVAAAAPTVPALSRAAERRNARESARRQRETVLAEQRAHRNRRGETPAVAMASAAAARRVTNETPTMQPPRYAGVAFAPSQAVVQPVPTSRPAPAAAQTPPDESNTPQEAATASSAAIATRRDRPPAAAQQSSGGPASGNAAPGPNVQMAAVAPPPSPTVPRPQTPLVTTSAATTSPIADTLPAVSRAVSPSTSPGTASTAGARADTPALVVNAVAPTTISETAPKTLAIAAPATAAVMEPQRVVASAPVPATRAAVSEDTILARIMAGISIPGAELGIAPVRPPEPNTEPAPRTGSDGAALASVAAATNVASVPGSAASGAVRSTRDANGAGQPSSAELATRRTQASAGFEAAVKEAAAAAEARATASTAKKVGTGAGKEPAGAEAQQSAADAKAAAAKKLADAKKEAEAKKLADAKKAEDAKKAAEVKKVADAKAAAAKAAKAEPSRIWVQVAGGANKDDLPKAWAAAQNKAAALKGKTAFTTPLRATNRVVTGPFKTDQEAREFVNTLAKQGVSAFPFTSDEGQKMSRLP